MALRTADARAELFAGSSHAEAPKAPNPFEESLPNDINQMNNKQIMTQAVRTHEQTTQSAQRALQIVEETKVIQAQTNAVLRDQGRQMANMEGDFQKMNEDIGYADKLLRYMRLCCCISFFCSCCTEPVQDSGIQNQKQPSGSEYYTGPTAQSQPQPNKGKAPMGNAAQSPLHANLGYANPDTSGLQALGFGQEQATIERNTNQQNSYLNEISKGLEALKHGAMDMQVELAKQNDHLDNLDSDATKVQSQLYNLNTKTQLRKYYRPPK